MIDRTPTLDDVRAGCRMRGKNLADLARARGWKYNWLNKIINGLQAPPPMFRERCTETFTGWDLDAAAAQPAQAEQTVRVS
jgi:hypothetical protein